MEDRWFGKAFQIFIATDENDLEAAMVVLKGRAPRGTGLRKKPDFEGSRAPKGAGLWRELGSERSRARKGAGL